jgi:hypothetical protein
MKRALIGAAIGSVLARKSGTVVSMGGEPVGLARANFKDRIAAMQMRGTIRTCEKNARREYNRIERKRLDGMAESMAHKAMDAVENRVFALCDQTNPL